MFLPSWTPPFCSVRRPAARHSTSLQQQQPFSSFALSSMGQGGNQSIANNGGVGNSSTWVHPRPSRRRNPAESHILISSHQGFCRRNLVCFGLVGNWCGASDHKFSKYNGIEAIVFFTLLFSQKRTDPTGLREISRCALFLKFVFKKGVLLSGKQLSNWNKKKSSQPSI